MTAAPERKIGRFSILKVLGRGAQGAVYLAKDPDLGRLVAVKLVAEIHYGSGEDAGPSPQARNLAQLRHPNIVALHEAGRVHGFTYLVFEYLEGTVLREELAKSGPMGLPQAYSTMIQIVDAMAYAHAKGILHLDLNPNNIMRDEAGRPRIVHGTRVPVRRLCGRARRRVCPRKNLPRPADGQADGSVESRRTYDRGDRSGAASCHLGHGALSRGARPGYRRRSRATLSRRATHARGNGRGLAEDRGVDRVPG
jgi:serine/threonine protein kinase